MFNQKDPFYFKNSVGDCLVLMQCPFLEFEHSFLCGRIVSSGMSRDVIPILCQTISQARNQHDTGRNWFIFNILHGVMSQKKELFATITVRTFNFHSDDYSSITFCYSWLPQPKLIMDISLFRK
jgi:hypothetical protein